MSYGTEKMAEVKKEVEKVLAFYKSLQNMPIADKVVTVSDEAEPTLEKHAPKVTKALLLAFNKRAGKAESQNAVLRSFEDAVVRGLTVSKTSVVFREIHKLVWKLEFLLSHAGEITLILASVLGWETSESGKLNEYWSVLKGAAVRILDEAREGETDEIARDTVLIGEQGMKIAREVAESATLALLAVILQQTIIGIGEGKWAGMIKPVHAAAKVATQALQSSAFPQGKGRVRRRKRSRRN